MGPPFTYVCSARCDGSPYPNPSGDRDVCVLAPGHAGKHKGTLGASWNGRGRPRVHAKGVAKKSGPAALTTKKGEGATSFPSIASAHYDAHRASAVAADGVKCGHGAAQTPDGRSLGCELREGHPGEHAAKHPEYGIAYWTDGAPDWFTSHCGEKWADPVNHPAHYTAHPSGVECITIVEHMTFCAGNAVKYLWRAGLKGDALEDLKKAEWYIRQEILRLEKEKNNG